MSFDMLGSRFNDLRDKAFKDYFESLALESMKDKHQSSYKKLCATNDMDWVFESVKFPIIGNTKFVDEHNCDTGDLSDFES